MEGLPVQSIPGRTRHSWIFHCGDGYHYNMREVRHSRIRLACRHRKSRGLGCLGTATVSLQTGMLRHGGDHNHQPDPLLPEELELRRVAIQEAAANVQGKRLILDELKLSASSMELASRFTRVRMASSLYAARSKNYPKIPHTLLHLGVLLGTPQLKRLCKTADGADFIFQGVIGCDQSRTVALVFASGRMLEFLQTRQSVHMDGTFKKRAKRPTSAQIFNVVAKYGQNVIAMVRVLMLSRTEAAYMEVFNYLKVLAPNFHPRRVHCDFEKALMNAVKAAFPQCRVVGCLWHYAVCIGKKSRSLGLSSLAHRNQLVFSFISCLCALPLLPQALLWRGVLEVWNEVELSGWGPELLPLFQYWEAEWKPRVSELSVFGDPDRTNNCSESDNRMLSNAIPQNAPNIWFLIGGFVRLEHSAWCDKLAIDQLRPVAPSRRYEVVLNDRRVQMASQLLQNGDISVGRFLHSLSYSIHAATLNGLFLGNEAEDVD